MSSKWSRQEHNNAKENQTGMCPFNCIYCGEEAAERAPLPPEPVERKAYAGEHYVFSVRRGEETLQRCQLLAASDDMDAVWRAITDARNATVGANTHMAGANDAIIKQRIARFDDRRRSVVDELLIHHRSLKKKADEASQATLPALITKAENGATLSMEEKFALTGEAAMNRRSSGPHTRTAYLYTLAAASSNHPHPQDVYAAANAAGDGENDVLRQALQRIGGRIKHRRLTSDQARGELRGVLRQYASWFDSKNST